MTASIDIDGYRIVADVERTILAYTSYPKISENCSCEDCRYFEDHVVLHGLHLFNLLKSMGVDLARQPPHDDYGDGVCFVGPTTEYEIGVIGNYKVFGELHRLNEHACTEKILLSDNIHESAKDAEIDYMIIQHNDQLVFKFFLEIEKRMN